ncbi:GGDEF domain-containing protein [Paucibacter sp. R3-3]|uniref:GGDEF domain-containing protein n=1 Tax=Roseateles agri TaxID=3098619 RepID=A0ABU5DS14_9BURK|nr:GGDEF domain-containing protein [Paucibacter sp. R3-3]MDY0748034.1 GGDEF domain-containing protein [Paucibacter sp. R3-3]
MTPHAPVTQSLKIELDQLIASQNFDIHFQPIVDVAKGRIMGYEALTRAPATSALHSPLVLFDLAATVGRLIELERLITRRIARRFIELQLPGRLFMNLTADTLVAAKDRHELIAQDLGAIGVRPSSVVLELTETRPVIDMESLDQTAESLRQVGFSLALDDLGEGFASLKRWVDLRPEFVKIDRHFIDGVAGDPLKQQFVRSILEMASQSEACVIAEGVEQEGDLRILRGIGIHLCQGYFFARPSPTPRTSLRAEIVQQLNLDPVEGATSESEAKKEIVARDLSRAVPTAHPAMTCSDVIALFAADEHLYSMPVLDGDGPPLGILRSASVLKRGAERFFVDLFGRKSCLELMDRSPLVFDAEASLQTMSEAVANTDDRYMVDGFLITRQGRYVGAGRTSDLFKAIASHQLLLARDANPLTLLPGNVMIERQMAALLNSGEEFVVAYWDLTSFKPFNDTLGYRAGDEVIRYVGRLLTESVDDSGGFVGHVGGDDFITLLTTPDWEAQLGRICKDFDHGLHRFVDVDTALNGGYRARSRQGEETFYRLPTLCAGVLKIAPGQFSSVRQVSLGLVEPKRRAKAILDRSGFFIERRRT